VFESYFSDTVTFIAVGEKWNVSELRINNQRGPKGGASGLAAERGEDKSMSLTQG
jgi:hypothetical protein